MYLIADKNLKITGTLSLDGGCAFFDDLRVVKIADEQGKVWTDTLEISVPYGFMETDMMTEGYHLLKEYENGRWYAFRINEWEDIAVGRTHMKKVSAINLCAWDLNKTVPTKDTLKNASATIAYNYVLQRSGWIADVDSDGDFKTYEIDNNSNAMSWIDTLNKDYEKEMRAYVQIRNGKVFNKVIEIRDGLGEKTGRRIEYGRNVVGINRTGSDTEMYTKLYVFGGNLASGESATIANANDGKLFIVDDAANDTWNGGNKYLEGFVKHETILDPQGLKYWGEEQLKFYNHPKYNYTIDVAELNFDADLGDTLQVVDFEMSPILTVISRVVQKEISEADPTKNKIILGEYNTITTVTPDLIGKLQDQINNGQNKDPYRIELSTTNGTSFKNGAGDTTIIARVFKGNRVYNVEPSQIVWEKINADGSHDLAWERANKNFGNVITVAAIELQQKAVFRAKLVLDGYVYISADFFKREIDSVIMRVDAIADNDCVVIPIITDTHYATDSINDNNIKARSMSHFTNAVELTHQINTDALVHLGDLVDGHSTKASVTSNVKAAVSELSKSATPYFIANGNHDNNSWGDESRYLNDGTQTITSTELHDLISKKSESFGYVTNKSDKSSYGYYDIKDKKTRMFILNSFDVPFILVGGKVKYPIINKGGFQQAQITWFANSLKSTPADYKVVIMLHQSLQGIFNTSATVQPNGDIIKAIILAYKNGTNVNMTSNIVDYKASISVNFSGKRDVCAIFNGHYHQDYTSVAMTVPCVAIIDSLARAEGVVLDRTVNTRLEDGFDVMILNSKTRTINLVRFGAGIDRQIKY